ncbi:hypothetical protein ACQ4M4_02555 [Leptolyngbya sp. AN02str]|uniref:hypothetical protein n=1 Tax=Leptolyngbya sp. AN02str TaxID=3423363 RepID=UPI003D3117D1
MFNRNAQQKHLLNRLEKPLTAALLSTAFVATGLAQVGVAAVEAFSDMKVAAAPTGLSISQRMPNGVYVYGQVPEAEQIGAAYMVFSVQDDDVVGAFYMPQSSFDCFYGEVQQQQLALNIIDSYAQDVYPYAVAVAPSGNVAANGDDATVPMTLEGFHRLEEVTENDQRILGMCQSDVQSLN